MLEKAILFPFVLFFLLAFAFLAVTGVVMFVEWNAVQNQAQFLAASLGKWGGYTQEAENAVRDFAARLGLARSEVRVEVSDVGPVAWGTPVWVRVTVLYHFRLGSWQVGSYSLTGLGRSVSSYLPGAYQVGYVSP